MKTMVRISRWFYLVIAVGSVAAAFCGLIPARAQQSTPITIITSGGDAIIPDVFVLPKSSLSSLVRGDNVLAVEVHQNATNSDDIVFGASVTLKFTSSPPVIFQQPVDLSVLDGRSAMLSAVIDGDPAPLLQWYQNGSPVPGSMVHATS